MPYSDQCLIIQTHLPANRRPAAAYHPCAQSLVKYAFEQKEGKYRQNDQAGKRRVFQRRLRQRQLRADPAALSGADVPGFQHAVKEENKTSRIIPAATASESFLASVRILFSPFRHAFLSLPNAGRFIVYPIFLLSKKQKLFCRQKPKKTKPCFHTSEARFCLSAYPIFRILAARLPHITSARSLPKSFSSFA